MNPPLIYQSPPFLLAGLKTMTSLSEMNPFQLWSRFMPLHKNIPNLESLELYAVQVFPEGLTMDSFTPDTVFEMWAAAPISQSFESFDSLHFLHLEGGLYAVFTHKGKASDFPKTREYIFSEWLPNSGYRLDHRPHLQVMGEKYRGHENPESEEAVWIPIRKKPDI